MGVLVECVSVFLQFDVIMSIVNPPERVRKWLLENEKNVTQCCRTLGAELHLKAMRDEYNYTKTKDIKQAYS